MARPMMLVFDDEPNSFQLKRLTREKLYGRRRHIVVDAMGQTCQRGDLTDDGELLLGPGDTAQLYIDDDHNSHARKTLVHVDSKGERLPKIPSTLGREMPLTGPVNVERVLDHATVSIYTLDPEALGERLQQALAEGHIYETAFAYRAGTSTQPMFILQNKAGFFGLLCEPLDFDFVEPDESFNEDDIDDLLSELLDDFMGD